MRIGATHDYELTSFRSKSRVQVGSSDARIGFGIEDTALSIRRGRWSVPMDCRSLLHTPPGPAKITYKSLRFTSEFPGSGGSSLYPCAGCPLAPLVSRCFPWYSSLRPTGDARLTKAAPGMGTPPLSSGSNWLCRFHCLPASLSLPVEDRHTAQKRTEGLGLEIVTKRSIFFSPLTRIPTEVHLSSAVPGLGECS